MSSIKGVIFDCDGLLLDTESIFARNVKEVTGYELTPQLHLAIMGVPALKCGEILLNAYKIEGTPAEFMDNIDSHLRMLLPECEFFPGAENLINTLHSMKIPMAIATGSSRANYDAKIVRHEKTLSKISAVVTGDDVVKGKPDPEIFLKAMKLIGLENPEECIVFEDSPHGIKAAVDAGFPCVMVPDKNFPYQKILDSYGIKPTYLLNSLEEFKLQMFNFKKK